MLTKLIKYDLKSLARILIPTNLFLLIYALGARLVITSGLSKNFQTSLSVLVLQYILFFSY